MGPFQRWAEGQTPYSPRDAIQERFSTLGPFLNEKQRRLLAGVEARTYGEGGIAHVAEVTGMSPMTVSRGVKELETPSEIEPERVRRPGGGRTRMVDIDPALQTDLERLVDPVTRGEPDSPLRWTTKSLRKLAAELQSMGHHVSPFLVTDLLHATGYSLLRRAPDYAEWVAPSCSTGGFRFQELGIIRVARDPRENPSLPEEPVGRGSHELTTEAIDRFLAVRRAQGRTERISSAATAPLLGYLRPIGVAPEPSSEPPAATELERLLEEYRTYLGKERGLAASTVEHYLTPALLFLSKRSEMDGLGLKVLTAAEVTAFVVQETRGRRTASAQWIVTGVRALLRFLHVTGKITSPLAQVVPGVAGWHLSALPKALEANQVDRLLASCDQETPVGLRDFPSSQPWYALVYAPERWPP